MAKRRMLSISIVETDKFYKLKSGAQALYMHLNLNADDDGVVDRVRGIMRDTRASGKNYQALIDEGYVIDLGEGLALITHWNLHNKIKKDRYVPSDYRDIISNFQLDANARYFKASEDVLGAKCAPQDSKAKESIGKESIDKESNEDNIEENIIEEQEEEDYSFNHSLNKEEDLKIPSLTGSAGEPTGVDIDYNRFLSQVKLYYMTRHKSIDCIDFIVYYEGRNWIADNGDNVKENYREYIDRWKPSSLM